MKSLMNKINNAFIPFCICFFVVFLVLFSSSNLIAARNGLNLWALAVVPSLFPFFIATELLSYTNIIQIIGKLLNKIMRPIFNVPGEGAFALIMGFLCGYPIGAKIVSNLKKQGICNEIECERLISFTNNSGPLFIIGTVGINMFNSKEVGYALLFAHIMSSFFVGFTFRWWKRKNHSYSAYKSGHYQCGYKSIDYSNIGEILSFSFKKATESILLIGGFIVFFSVIISMLESSRIINILCLPLYPLLKIFNLSYSYAPKIIIGFTEITNGIHEISVINNYTSIILCSFFLGFSGLSVMLQILSITHSAKISFKPYIIGKFLQAIISSVLMWFILYIF